MYSTSLQSVRSAPFIFWLKDGVRNHTLLQPVILSFFLPSSVRHLLWALIKYSYSFLFHYSYCPSSWLSSSHIGIDLYRRFHNYRAHTYPVVTTAALSFVVFFFRFSFYFFHSYIITIIISIMGISITLIRATPCCRVTKVMIQKDVEEKKFFEREWNVMHHDVLFDRWARPGEMDSEEVFENRNGDEFLFRWAFNWSFHRQQDFPNFLPSTASF